MHSLLACATFNSKLIILGLGLFHVLRLWIRAKDHSLSARRWSERMLRQLDYSRPAAAAGCGACDSVGTETLCRRDGHGRRRRLFVVDFRREGSFLHRMEVPTLPEHAGQSHHRCLFQSSVLTLG